MCLGFVHIPKIRQIIFWSWSKNTSLLRDSHGGSDLQSLISKFHVMLFFIIRMTLIVQSWCQMTKLVLKDGTYQSRIYLLWLTILSVSRSLWPDLHITSNFICRVKSQSFETKYLKKAEQTAGSQFINTN